MAKRQKRAPLILSAATRATAINWKEPSDISREFSRDLEPWIQLAQLAENGKLHSIFFVDHLSWFDVYGHSHEASARTGVNVSRLDPSTVIIALAQATKSIGFSLTGSTISEHPYHFARRLATIDQLTNGRVGWNIVGSYLPSSGPNLLNGAGLPEHDERYVRTTEYLDAIYSLFLSSWRDDAIVYDKINHIFADPSRIRKINHKGKYFDIEGPAVTEPTKQRIPLIIQAGSSEKGKLFAAENAEMVYVHNNQRTASDIADIRSLASKKFRRDPNSIKFIISLTVYVGKTHQEAVDKQEESKMYKDEEDVLVYFGGKSNIDLSDVGWDDPVPFDGHINGVAEMEDNIKSGDRLNTKRQVVDNELSKRSKYVGTPNEIADLIEHTIEETGADGLNFAQTSFPSGLKDVVELLIPELQSRGLAQREYTIPRGTYRENFYGIKGQRFLPKDHPAYNLRWRAGISKEAFEYHLSKYENLRDKRRQE